MNRLKIFHVILLVGLIVHLLTACDSVTVRGMIIPINGSVDAVDGVPVISLWGTPWEQGFAYGYLYQEKIVQLFKDFLASGKIMNPAAFAFEHDACLTDGNGRCTWRFPWTGNR